MHQSYACHNFSLWADNQFGSGIDDEILLDTKYYTTRVPLISVKDVEEAIIWKNSNPNVQIGALICYIISGAGNFNGLTSCVRSLKSDVQVVFAYGVFSLLTNTII